MTQRHLYNVVQENVPLIINFNDKKLLIPIMTNLDTNLQIKKLLVTKIIIVIKKNYN